MATTSMWRYKNTTYSTGQGLVAAFSIHKNGDIDAPIIIKAGNIVTLVEIIPIDNTDCHVGLVSAKKVSGWSSHFEGYDGYYGTLWPISKVHEYFMPHMQFLKEAKVVKGDFLFKKRNLKDLPCKIVFPIGTSHDVMVEFDEDIGGCSGDGHGKQGHCVVIDKRSLIKETKRKER